MKVSDIKKAEYNQGATMVILNGNRKEQFPINHVLVEAWRNLGNTVKTYIPTKDELVVAIKQEAAKRINATCPDYKQRNMLASVVDTVTRENQSFNDVQNNVANASLYIPTTAEKAEIKNYQDIKLAIDNIRSKSNELENSLDSKTSEELQEFDVTNNTLWE